MQRPLLVIGLSVVLSSLLSYVIVTNAGVEPAPAETLQPEPVHEDGVSQADLDALRSRLDDLSMELALLRDEVSRQRTPVDPGPSIGASPSSTDQKGPASVAPQFRTDDAFKAQVAQAVSELEEARKAEEREEELEERRKEAVDANEEYDWLERDLGVKIDEMTTKLDLNVAQTRELESLITVQNDRNREMTRLWSEGQTSDEDLEDLYFENRRAHREALTALLQPSQLKTYQEYLTSEGLGGRFSFFVGPWEDWSEEDDEPR